MSVAAGHQTDEELIAELRDGPDGATWAFDELVLRHQGKVIANCRYLTRSPGDAEDLAQEIFVKAYYGLSRFEGRSAFGTWLYRIKVNHCLNFIEKKHGRFFVDIDDVAAVGHESLRSRSTPEETLKSRTDQEHIGRVLDQMEDTLRIPLVLRDLDGLSYQDIADELQIGLSAVKMRIKRGRDEFRQLWEERESR